MFESCLYMATVRAVMKKRIHVTITYLDSFEEKSYLKFTILLHLKSFLLVVFQEIHFGTFLLLNFILFRNELHYYHLHMFLLVFD